jgi:hypothetical protein
MTFPFIKNLGDKKRARSQSDRRRYFELIDKLVRAGQLRKPDEDDLERLADGLGKSVEEIEADVAVVAELIEAERAAAAKPAKLKAWQTADKIEEDFKLETQRLIATQAQLMKDREAEAGRLSSVRGDAQRDVEAAVEAGNRVTALRLAHWQLLQLPERPAPKFETFRSYSGEIGEDWMRNSQFRDEPPAPAEPTVPAPADQPTVQPDPAPVDFPTPEKAAQRARDERNQQIIAARRDAIRQNYDHAQTQFARTGENGST